MFAPALTLTRPRLLRMALAALAGVVLGLTWPALAGEERPEPRDKVPLEDLRAFAEVLDRVRTAYVEDVPDRELLENAIRGMLDALDPHSGYLDEAAYRALQESTAGQFNGVGVEVEMADGQVTVIAPIDGTPAAAAGLRSGDVLLEVNGASMLDASLAKAVQAMRGPVGSDVDLLLRRPAADNSEEALLEVRLTRRAIAIDSVRGELHEPDYAVVRISQFQTSTGHEFRDALAALVETNGGPLRGLVLDLRNNPGGVLQASVEVTDALLGEGLIVYTEGRIANAGLRFSAGPGDLLDGAPIVVLVNGGSASASEIVAGALQDHRRALVMGSTSFGKGSVQTVLPLEGERAIKLTTALYYTPDGRSFQDVGITPDLPVAERRGTDAPMEEALTVLKGYHLLGLKTEGRTP